MASLLMFTSCLAYSPNWDRASVFAALVDHIVQNKISGDYVETGVHTGDSAVAVGVSLHKANELRTSNNQGRQMWLYDAWQGMPEAEAKDGATAAAYLGWGSRSQADVAERFTNHNIPKSAIVWRKGWFNETFPLRKPTSVAFLHVDSDWYRSVMDTLDSFYDRVVEGGIVLFDDFGYWEGCRVAFYDFCQKRKLYPLTERVGHTQMYVSRCALMCTPSAPLQPTRILCTYTTVSLEVDRFN